MTLWLLFVEFLEEGMKISFSFLFKIFLIIINILYSLKA